VPFSESADDGSADRCYRCGYDLRGVADDQPCTECGLLAGRSRRPTDELHDTRPGWLARLSWGIRLIVLAAVMLVAAPFVGAILRFQFAVTPSVANFSLRQHTIWVGADISVLLFAAGIFLLTGPEGYELADRDDARRRRLLRLGVLPSVLAMVLLHLRTQVYTSAMFAGPIRTAAPSFLESESFFFVIVLLLTVGMSLLPILLALQLRSLAKRARSAHLAEHCVIVGIGNAVTLLYIPAAAYLIYLGAEGTFGSHWAERSSIWLALMVALLVLSILFALWNLYLLVRFALAFRSASCKLRGKWRHADRSTVIT
jgi:hypothetical protein